MAFSLTDRAKAENKVTADWLRSLPFGGDEAARQFSLVLDRELPNLCADVAERLATGINLPRPDEAASIAFARPAFKHTFTTATKNRKRGQATGVYFLYYALLSNADGFVNELRVLSIRHSASEPLTAQFDRSFADTADEGE